MPQPNPSQFTTGDDLSGYTGGLNAPQKAYINKLNTAPKAGDLYNQYAKEAGIDNQQKVVTGLDRSILDLEGKIKNVEPTVNKGNANFLVTEPQRARMVNAEETPLRDQYLEAMRRRESAAAGLSATQSLISDRVKYSLADNANQADIFKSIADFTKSSDTGFDLNGFLTGLGGTEAGGTKGAAVDPNSPNYSPSTGNGTMSNDGKYVYQNGSWIANPNASGGGALSKEVTSTLDQLAQEN